MPETHERVSPPTASQAWKDLFGGDHLRIYRRVAQVVSGAEPEPIDEIERRRVRDAFEQAMACGDFLPNSPTLVNAGTQAGVLSGCFVLPISADQQQTTQMLGLMKALHRQGAGTGFSFSSVISEADGMDPGHSMAGLIGRLDQASQAGINPPCRSGANMGVLRIDHPAIHRFISLKRESPGLSSFNLSIGVTDHFMQFVNRNQRFALRDPGTSKPVTRVWAADLFREIAQAAWACGDPGLIFLDAIRREDPVPSLGPLECTNPCGEAPLLPYESCNLGSINLANMLYREQGGGVSVDWAHLEKTVRLAIRFLDDVIDAACWPDDRIASATLRTRKIGLGVMGFADLLVRLRVRYDSDRAEQIATQLMSFINHVAHSASEELAEQRGCFPAWAESIYAQKHLRMRNAVCTSIAPTGTISRLVGVNPGIEPFLELAVGLNESGVSVPRPCNALRRFAEDTHRDPQQLAEYARVNNSLADAPGLHDAEARLFRTATEVSADRQLLIQSAFQQHTDQAVAKTVNLPTGTTVEEVEAVFKAAWDLMLKGVTVYRWGCRDSQPYGSKCVG